MPLRPTIVPASQSRNNPHYPSAPSILHAKDMFYIPTCLRRCVTVHAASFTHGTSDDKRGPTNNPSTVTSRRSRAHHRLVWYFLPDGVARVSALWDRGWWLEADIPGRNTNRKLWQREWRSSNSKMLYGTFCLKIGSTTQSHERVAISLVLGEDVSA